MARLEAEVLDLFNLIIPAAAWAAEEGFASDEMRDRLAERTSVVWRDRYAAFPPGEIRKNIRYIVLTTLDEAWRQHIAALEHLRLGIPLRGYAHAVPLQEYRREAYDFLEQTLERFRDNVVRAVSRMVPVLDAPPPVPAGPADPTFTVMHVKRLQACPCGSGRRYKDCHGRIAEEAGSAVAAGG
jgi:preprotein translocase subunit SecA